MALGSHRGFYLCTFYVDFEIIGGVLSRFNVVSGSICGAIFMGSLAWAWEHSPLLPLVGLVLASFVFGVLLAECE